MVNQEERDLTAADTPAKAPPSHFHSLWPISVVVASLTFVVIFYSAAGKYEHVAPGKFLGPLKCKECHPAVYEAWKETRMAKSFEVLRPGQKVAEKKSVGMDPEFDYTKDKGCLPCHTTGYGLAGGFVSFEKTPEMAGVSCEACHGNGGAYVGSVMDAKDPSFSTAEAQKAGLVYPPTEQVCRTCHNSDSPFVGMDYKFDFAAMKQLGTHEHHQLQYGHK